MRNKSLFLAAVFFLSPLALAEVSPAEALVQKFYAWTLAHPNTALPSPKERAALSQLLSADLLRLLDDAVVAEKRCIKTAPRGDKPNIVEGNLFVGNYEGATEVAPGDVHLDGEHAFAEPRLFSVDRRFPKGHKFRVIAWKDRVELGLVGGHWVVTNVKFENGRSLQQNLQEYLAESKREC